MKKIIYILLGILLVSTVSAVTYKGFEYLVVDKIKGSDLEVTEFDDEYGFVDQLIYDGILKRNSNDFSADFEYGITEEGDEHFVLEDLRLSGQTISDDGSSVKYELVDFEVVDTYLDEWGTSQGWGTATLVYKQEIVIERQVQVEVAFDFWRDEEDRDNFVNQIYIYGEDVSITLEDEGEKNKVSHRRRCYVGCED